MPARKPRPAFKPDNRQEKAILDRLSAGLSEEEIQRVLAGALSTLGSGGIARLSAKLGPDTGAALRRAMQSSTKKVPPKPGPAKVLQEWKRAWRDWGGVISEACDEEGKYVVQEHHWEEPYFDPLSVTEDLEPIAARMAALLPRVFDEDLDPDCSFAEAAAGMTAARSRFLPASPAFFASSAAISCVVIVPPIRYGSMIAAREPSFLAPWGLAAAFLPPCGLAAFFVATAGLFAPFFSPFFFAMSSYFLLVSIDQAQPWHAIPAIRSFLNRSLPVSTSAPHFAQTISALRGEPYAGAPSPSPCPGAGAR